ncbi:chaplin [Streptomyces pathocidini]|uniref:Chaplin n=1 Tax=Streptomyces pathocidini TaxID=1650571 RepID=A0ABW7UWC5_9ACTN|nr:chaplin [Streptomyces pathocidini]
MSRIVKAAVLTVAAGMAVAGASGVAAADAGGTHGAAVGSPGVLSGNLIQTPVYIPINVCGNGLNVIALGNPPFGNKCANVSAHEDRREVYSHSDHRDDHYKGRKDNGYGGYKK